LFDCLFDCLFAAGRKPFKQNEQNPCFYSPAEQEIKQQQASMGKPAWNFIWNNHVVRD